MTAALVLHGGGPTAVLNASLTGIVEAARGKYTRLYAALHGDLARCIDLFTYPAEFFEQAATAPGSLIGSTRAKPDVEETLGRLRRQDVRTVFYTGGNGTMRAASLLEQAAAQSRFELHVIGVPKTIDNDISETDHTPGYGSAARFAALFARDTGEDNRSLPSTVMVLETLGRDTGWVVAATALARCRDGDAPHLVYLPERRLSEDQLLADVEAVYSRYGRCVLAVCEGQRDSEGGTFGADLLPGIPLAANLGHTMARLITTRLGVRARAEKPGLLGRSCALLASDIGRDEARRCAQSAVAAALQGNSGKMVALIRETAPPYQVRTELCDLRAIALRKFPWEWIGEHGPTTAFLEWVKPLVGEVPSYSRLR